MSSTPQTALLWQDFYRDWAKVANDEAHHYQRWLAQLGVIGGTYGYTPAHAMLWEAAAATSDSLASRLVLVNLVHEARGLDTYSLAKKRFEVRPHAGLQAL